MVAHALGVAPFKDNFWTTTNQPGNPYCKCAKTLRAHLNSGCNNICNNI